MAKDNFKWKHKTNTLTYNSWRSMRNRCLSDSDSAKYYKDKGITICSEWVDDFDKFVEDMGERPENTSIDRIDSSGNYEPANCRWVDWRIQQNNKPGLTAITYNGETHTIGEWAYILDLTPSEYTRARKRYASYGASTFEELFYDGCLLSKRVSERINLCKICGSDSSCKWRKFGELCNNCYARANRWSVKTKINIEEFPEWENITWKT